MEYAVESGSYKLKYILENEEVIITGFEGAGSRMLVPDKVLVGEKEYVVMGLGKKAILANKGLREISLPGTVTKIDDWAMAQCENMQIVILRGDGEIKNYASQLYFGRGVFDHCNKIQNICLGYEQVDAQSALLGAIIHRMPAEYLLKDKDLGTPAWYAKWDQCLSTFLNEPDLDGYTDMVLCGEEDIFYQEPDFAMNKRKKKSALCLLRLYNGIHIAEDMKKKFQDYLLAHTKGCRSEEAWETLLEEFGENVSYIKLFADLGCITKENIDAMLLDMGERFAESKAYLLNYKQTAFGSADVFSMFDL